MSWRVALSGGDDCRDAWLMLLRSEHSGDHVHRDVTGGWLRPAVFGAMDGLVVQLRSDRRDGRRYQRRVRSSSCSRDSPGWPPGAFSMAAGEYTSVASQRELARAEIEVERREIQRHPTDEERELSETYQGKGLDPELADKVAQQFHANPDQALEEHVREELGLDPNDLPSPVVAAASSFICFAIGALIPAPPVPPRRLLSPPRPDHVPHRPLHLRRRRQPRHHPLLVVLRPPPTHPRRQPPQPSPTSSAPS